jgi:nitrate/TMAO reductase-like tetraheme cytochrome c subunit
MAKDRDKTLESQDLPLPTVFYNAITGIGAALAATSLGLILFLVVLESLAEEHKPYVGILAFVVLPVFLVIGLIMIAVGAMREGRRRRQGLPPTQRLPIVNFNNPKHRRVFALIVGGGILFLILSAFGSYKAYEYTDSDEFCGTVCHNVMHPEYTAYEGSPHSRVGCAKCHIGPGAGWFVRSKLSGAYQVYSVLFDKYPRPIHTPIANLRPSSDTCEQCHWPEKFYTENFLVNDYYLSDEENTNWRLDLLMHIGGGDISHGPTSGIHWHIANQVEYVATDAKRTEIPWIRVTDAEGNVSVFQSTEADFSDDDLATAEIRTMDCIDCHNRPTHVYRPAPQLVNRAMASGRLDRTLPEIKLVATEAMETEYETAEEAQEGIREAIVGHFNNGYAEIGESRPDDVEHAVAVVQDLYNSNYFPEMKVSWRHFPNHIGHMYSPGCFRCHDGYHENDEGEVITRDCNVCHTILAQESEAEGQRVALGGVEYHHPEDIDEAWKEMNCSECHGE